MEARRLERIKRRFCCEIVDASQRHDGIVMNLTCGGLFVLTRAEIGPGTQLEIHVPARQDVPEMTLRAIVVRQRLVAGKSSRLISQGVGLRVLQAPETYYEIVERETHSSRGCVSRAESPDQRARSGRGIGSPHALGEYLRRMLSQGLGRTEEQRSRHQEHGLDDPAEKADG